MTSAILLYRGHADPDYLKTHWKHGLCFSTDKDAAVSYGRGDNDAGNPDVRNKYVTTVEFDGIVQPVDIHGWDLPKADLLSLKKYDAVRCKGQAGKGGTTVVVFNFARLKKMSTESASLQS